MTAKKPLLTPDENREKLNRVADSLRGSLDDIDRGFVYLSEVDAAFLATAFERFLSGKAASLDAAFGVKRGRGRLKRGPESEATMELVEKALWRGKKSWKDIARETDKEPRYLQRLANRHEGEAIDRLATRIAARLAEKDK
jgi:AraC-like DNA-binding protein